MLDFLRRFLKVFVAALLFAALGVLVFYWTVMAGKSLRSDISRGEYLQTIYTVLGALVGFIFALSIMIAITGMQQTITVPVYDRAGFLQRFQSTMASLRYKPFRETDGLLIFKPPIFGGLLSEKISVKFTHDTAIITAPRGLLRRIQGKLQVFAQ
ncbi:MAG: hypothetical protein QOJ64_396 [Acidobacteriota bacterium]|jgi:hypothetical protein|nr:hypothetical protein [Acidobacteriota bacterium]